jgi:hypothetical protein
MYRRMVGAAMRQQAIGGWCGPLPVAPVRPCVTVSTPWTDKSAARCRFGISSSAALPSKWPSSLSRRRLSSFSGTACPHPDAGTVFRLSYPRRCGRRGSGGSTSRSAQHAAQRALRPAHRQRKRHPTLDCRRAPCRQPCPPALDRPERRVHRCSHQSTGRPPAPPLPSSRWPCSPCSTPP